MLINRSNLDNEWLHPAVDAHTNSPETYAIAHARPVIGITLSDGFYDYLAQPPLLVVLVGLIFSLAIGRGLLKDLEGDDGTTR